MRLTRVQCLVKHFGDSLHFGVTDQIVLRRDLGGIWNHLPERVLRRTLVNRCIQTHRFFRRLENLKHLLLGEPHLVRDFFGRRLAAQFTCQGSLREFYSAACLADIARHPNHLPLLVQRAFNRLHDPPCRVSAEAVTERVIEFIDSLHQPEAPFLHQVEKGERGFAEVVLFRNASDETQVRLHNLLLRRVRHLVRRRQFVPQPFNMREFVANLLEDEPERARLPRLRLFLHNTGRQLFQQLRHLILQESKLLESEFLFRRAKRLCAAEFLQARHHIRSPIGMFFPASLLSRERVDAAADRTARVRPEVFTALCIALFDGPLEAKTGCAPQLGRRELRACSGGRSRLDIIFQEVRVPLKNYRRCRRKALCLFFQECQ